MDHALAVAREAAREAGELVRAAWLGGGVAAETKGVSIDLVTATDRAADDLLAARLRAAFPADELVLEETGLHPGDPGTPRRWYIDPLDGTTNFAHGFPHFAVTLALEIDGVIELGVTLGVPFLGGPGQASTSLRATYVDNFTSIPLTEMLGAIERLNVQTSSGTERPVFGWTIGGDESGEDGLVLRLEWEEGQAEKVWQFSTSPMRTTPLRAPILPDDLSDRVPSEMAANFTISAGLFDVDGIADAKAFREVYGPREPPTSVVVRRSDAAAQAL